MKLFNIMLSLLAFMFLGKLSYANDLLPSKNAVILMYHHVSDKTPPSTSISPEKFAEHMQYLADKHNVVPLKELIDAIKNNRPMPANSVAITFDDGYRNIAENGHPILRKHGFEYTIFINPPQIGVIPQQLDWQEVAQLMKEGVTFANHTSYHNHLLTDSDSVDWLKNTLADIELAESGLIQRINASLKFLAYPYGEYNQMLQQAIVEKGYIGFGQQSGAVASHSDFSALPRVPAAGIYSNLDTLKIKLSSFVMPVVDKTIKDPQRLFAQRRPAQTLTIDLADIHPHQFACYYQGKPIPLTWQDNRVSMMLEKDLPIGRSRINCTSPSKALPKRFYWYSQPWFVPNKDGQWPN
jgi:peptidoglycan/xylan/chitin deacetylase (PgdA/CDA1 family)